MDKHLVYLQVRGNQRELVQRRLQVLGNLGRNDFGGGQIGGVFQTLVL